MVMEDIVSVAGSAIVDSCDKKEDSWFVVVDVRLGFSSMSESVSLELPSPPPRVVASREVAGRDVDLVLFLPCSLCCSGTMAKGRLTW